MSKPKISTGQRCAIMARVEDYLRGKVTGVDLVTSIDSIMGREFRVTHVGQKGQTYVRESSDLRCPNCDHEALPAGDDKPCKNCGYSEARC